MFSKKAQEEMVGFVLIVVIISIIGVIFLGISLRGSDDNVIDESQRINSLIGALGQTTSACELPDSHFLDVSDLIRECSQGKVCSNCEGETCGSTNSACEVLENTLAEALSASYVVTDGSYTRYYNLSVFYDFDGRPLIEPLIEGPQESCPGTKLFNQRSYNDQGDRVNFYLEVCFNS